jgi:hypothetical protein
MKNLIARILVASFLMLTLLILLPSTILLFTRGAEVVTPSEVASQPKAPAVITLPSLDANGDLKAQNQRIADMVSAYTQEVAGYTQQVNAYTATLQGYKAYLDSPAAGGWTKRYILVVKETLMPVYSTFVTALLGYIFVKALALTMDNRTRAAHGQPLMPLEF